MFKTVFGGYRENGLNGIHAKVIAYKSHQDKKMLPES